MDIAARTADFQSCAFHGGQMGAACDEGDIAARFRQRRAESTADPAGADNRNTHGFSPRLCP
jgi:hypothetical protein